MSTDFVDYTLVDASKVDGTTPESKTVPNTTTSYNQLPLNYNYGSDLEPRIGNFYIQLPTVRSTGIMERIDEKTGKRSYSMYVPLPQSEETLKLFLEKFKSIFRATAEIIFRFKGPCKVQAPSVDMMLGAGLYKDPVYYPRDKATGEIIQGKSPSMYLKLLKKGAGTSEQKTLFTDLRGDAIDWKLLYNVDIKMIPLVHVENIYIGTKPSLQLKMVSAVVLEIAQRGTQTRQLSTIQNIVASDPNAVSQLERQIAKLTMDRQDANLPFSSPVNHSGQQQTETPADSSSGAGQTSAQTGLQNFLSGVSSPSPSNSSNTLAGLGKPLALNSVPPSPQRTPQIPQIPTFTPTISPTQTLN